MQNCGAAPKAQASRGWFRIASCVLSIAWRSRVSIIVACRSLLVARKMERKGGTVLLYEHMIENIGKYWKTFENCIEIFEKCIETFEKIREFFPYLVKREAYLKYRISCIVNRIWCMVISRVY